MATRTRPGAVPRARRDWPRRCAMTTPDAYPPKDSAALLGPSSTPAVSTRWTLPVKAADTSSHLTDVTTPSIS